MSVFFTRRGKPKGILPEGYVALNYIQSSGSQYIDTQYNPNNNTRIKCSVSDYNKSTNPTTSLYGSRSSQRASDYFCFNISGVTNYRSDYGNSRVDFSTSYSFSGKILVDQNRNICTITPESGNSVSVINSNLDYTFSGLFCYLFAENRGGSVYYRASVKMYYCEIYDNDILVRDFIPCKNDKNVIGMWDKVEEKFYENAGTGVFLGG